jgi:hypothetical protein
MYVCLYIHVYICIYNVYIMYVSIYVCIYYVFIMYVCMHACIILICTYAYVQLCAHVNVNVT